MAGIRNKNIKHFQYQIDNFMLIRLSLNEIIHDYAIPELI